jgi:hypothetical protein
MARFITVTVKCDFGLCDVAGEEGDGTVVEKTLSIDNKQARAFLLCKTHLEDFESLVLPLMAAGIKVETAPSKKSKTSSVGTVGTPASTNGAGAGSADSAVGSSRLDCRVPDCGRPMKNRAGLAQHVIRAHGFADLADYEATYPDSTID